MKMSVYVGAWNTTLHLINGFLILFLKNLGIVLIALEEEKIKEKSGKLLISMITKNNVPAGTVKIITLGDIGKINYNSESI